MLRLYNEIYPSGPLLNGEHAVHKLVAALMSVRYCLADPGSMPEDVFDEHSAGLALVCEIECHCHHH